MLVIRLAVEDEKKEISRLEKQVQLLRHSWLIGWLVGWLTVWLVDCLVGWLVGLVWLVWLVSWMVN